MNLTLNELKAMLSPINETMVCSWGPGRGEPGEAEARRLAEMCDLDDADVRRAPASLDRLAGAFALGVCRGCQPTHNRSA